jgi:hypothetical protein
MPVGGMGDVRYGQPLTIGWRGHRARLSFAKEWIDASDKSVLFFVGTTPRRSISSLEGSITASALMILFDRLRYSLYLASVGGGLIVLVVSIASADVVGWLPASRASFY